MRIKKSNRLTSFAVYGNNGWKHSFSIFQKQGVKIEMKEDVTNGAVVEFEGYKVKEPNFYQFVETDPSKSLKLPGYVWVAIAKTLDILNSDEEI